MSIELLTLFLSFSWCQEDGNKTLTHDLGITKKKVSEIIGLTYNTTNKMFNPNQERNRINADHVEKVKKYLKNYISKL